MQILNLTQGTPEWHAHRATARNASDAPAMLGCSKHKTRAALVREKATGFVPEVDAATQRRFDDGHRFEALARPLAQNIIGDELFPVSATSDDGYLSASLDGITLLGETAWEHKGLNNDLRAVLPEDGIGGAEVGASLPKMYRVQMEHQLAVSGAERVLFMASKWDADDELVEARYCWYYPDASLLRAEILAGWARLDADVANMIAKMANGEAFAEAAPVKAEQVETLPTVSVRLEGSIRVAGNLELFSDAVKAFIERIPENPETDAELEICAKSVKALKEAEAAIDAEESSALASIPDVEQMRRAIETLRKLVRDTRIAKEKMLKTRKDDLKEKAVFSARQALITHINELDKELQPARLNLPMVDFAAAIKGLRSIDSMNAALATALANGKIAADGKARTLRTNQAKFTELAKGYEHLFHDALALYHKSTEDFVNEVEVRIAKYNAAEAAKEAQRKADEEARIQRAAAEAAAKAAEQARAEERAAIQREADAKAAAARFEHKTTAADGIGLGNPAQAKQAAFIASNPRVAPSTEPRHLAPAPAPVAPQKPVLRVTEEHDLNENEDTASLRITLHTPDGKKIVMAVHDGEPEDNSLSRNFNGCYYVMEMIQAAYEAGKAGADLIIE